MSDETEVVKVLYDYKYTDDTGPIEIKTGDLYKLIEKTNDEWWHVYDPSGDSGESFFVPAQYVEIVAETKLLKNLTSADSLVPSVESSAESSQYYSSDSENEYSDADFRQRNDELPSSSFNGDYLNITNETSSGSGDGEYVNLGQYREAAGIKNVVDKELPFKKLTEPPKVDSIQGTVPPMPEDGTFIRVLSKHMPWDIYKDSMTRRLYYVNRETGERLWKPPRKVNAVPGQSSLTTATSSVSSSEENSGFPENNEKSEHTDSISSAYRSAQEKHQEPNWESHGHRLSMFGDQLIRAYGQLETTFGILTPPTNLTKDQSNSPSRVLNPQRPTNLTAPDSTRLVHQQTFDPVFINTDVYEGYLSKTKILDVSRKKVKKSWTLIYVVLQGSNLVFYKDQKSAVQRQGAPHGKPEAVVSLLGAHVDLNPKELTSKKNTILLRAKAGNVYLFQSENEKENLEWFTRMKIIANDVSPVEYSAKDFDAEEVQKDRDMTRSVSSDDATSLQNIDRTRNMMRIRAKLFNFISRRPTQEDLYKRGIIKDAVFGSRLHELCDREQVNVPNFVHRCIAAVESKGITHDGLYRISGNMAEIQRLRCTVDTDDNYNLYDEQWDIHVLTGALKLFFRELKESIFTFLMYGRFTDAIKKESRKEKLSAFKSAVSDLPRCNHATLKELFLHLCKVMDASHKNRMQSQNIAIVFGPTLLWQHESTEGLAIQTMYQNKIVEFILLEYKELFN